MFIKQDQDEIIGFLKDASNMPGGWAERVYFPECEDDVVAALAECRARGTPATAAGAGTGLAGGRVPFGGAVIATSRMNAILRIDADRMRGVVQPGVILGEFQQETERLDLLYPPDPTERTCFMGGTVATNSSGARTFKYGPTRAFIERIRVILADGDRMEIPRGRFIADGYNLSVRTEAGRVIELEVPRYTMPPIKHAAGYYARPGMDAIDLFIGSEGTLGIVTEIETRLIPLPRRLFSGIVFFADEPSTLAFVDEARERSTASRTGAAAGDIEARALEYIDWNALNLIRDRFPSIPDTAHGGAIWFEQETTEESEERLLELWYELIVKHAALADDSWFGIGLEDQKRMRAFRHAVPESVYEQISEHGQTKIGTDMAVPVERFAELLAFYRAQFAEHGLRNVIYGHIGNCHLHANIFTGSPAEHELAVAVYRRLVERALAMGGTISAEHGVGKLKKPYLVAMYGEEGIAGMRRVKKALDPWGILGSGTMFDSGDS
ncbi:MAG TPA: FAD-binding oxidoreductase [Candidatus Kapabacteria bacterium]|nr:FAD-binding oxidoreductase [Candidatus Kapabacteria bacterium]